MLRMLWIHPPSSSLQCHILGRCVQPPRCETTWHSRTIRVISRASVRPIISWRVSEFRLSRHSNLASGRNDQCLWNICRSVVQSPLKLVGVNPTWPADIQGSVYRTGFYRSYDFTAGHTVRHGPNKFGCNMKCAVRRLHAKHTQNWVAAFDERESVCENNRHRHRVHICCYFRGGNRSWARAKLLYPHPTRVLFFKTCLASMLSCESSVCFGLAPALDPSVRQSSPALTVPALRLYFLTVVMLGSGWRGVYFNHAVWVDGFFQKTRTIRFTCFIYKDSTL